MYLPLLGDHGNHLQPQAWRYFFNKTMVVPGGGRSVVVAVSLATFPLFERVDSTDDTA